MALRDRIKTDLDNAKEAGVKDAETLLKVIYTQILAKEKQLGYSLGDSEIETILNENVSTFKRTLATDTENTQLYWAERFLDSYVPNGLGRNEIRAKVGTFMAEHPKYDSKKAFEELKTKLFGKCDTKKLKECVDEAYTQR